MPDHTLPVIFHSGGELGWDFGSPIYNGDCPKMVFLKRSITYLQLVQRFCDISNWNNFGYISIIQYLNNFCHISIIQYLHQNGKICTLVRITNDEDVEIMFRASAGDTSALYLYIQIGAVYEIDRQGNGQR